MAAGLNGCCSTPEPRFCVAGQRFIVFLVIVVATRANACGACKLMCPTNNGPTCQGMNFICANILIQCDGGAAASAAANASPDGFVHVDLGEPAIR